MIKILRRILMVMVLCLLLFSLKAYVNAASIAITTSKSTVKPGESFTVTISAKNGAGYVKASVSNGTGKLDNTWLDNNSTSFTCKAGNTGNITITASGTLADYTTEDDQNVGANKTVNIETTSNTKNDSSKKNTTTNSKATKTTTKTTTSTQKENIVDKKEEIEEVEEVQEQEEIVKEYSLESLKVEGVILSPEFNKDIFEYEVIVEEKQKLELEAKPIRDNIIVEILGNENLIIGENIITINLKGQDDKEITTYKIKVINNKSDLTIAQGKVNKLYLINNILVCIIIVLMVSIIIMNILYINKIRKLKK